MLLLEKPLAYSRILTRVTFYVLSKFLKCMVRLYPFLIRKMKRNITGIFVPRYYGKFQHVMHLLTHLPFLRKCLQNFFLSACIKKIKIKKSSHVLLGEVVHAERQCRIFDPFQSTALPMLIRLVKYQVARLFYLASNLLELQL